VAAQDGRLSEQLSVDFGVMMFPTEYSVAPAELAVMVEQRGYESLFFPEHTHIPASRRTPYPAGGELPREYWHTYDPFIALTAAAAATRRLRIATGICLVIERDPITTAKEVASLDRLSGGRLLFGVGAGWNLEEMANHGTDGSLRFGVLRERVEAMKAIWTQEEASYHGRYVDFDPIWSQPKPLQRPHPPILVGGNGATVCERVLAYGDEWMPNAMPDADALRQRIRDFHTRAEASDRGRLGVTLYAAPAKAHAIGDYELAGVSRYVFLMQSTGREEAERRLEHLGGVIDEYRRAGA
jgi:probable F420-dependent oxidoreductase